MGCCTTTVYEIRNDHGQVWACFPTAELAHSMCPGGMHVFQREVEHQERKPCADCQKKKAAREEHS